MGSSLSPIVANLYMELFEEEAIATREMKRKLWLRYVNDSFILWQHGMDTLSAAGFLTHLNCKQKMIQFTMEIEDDRRLPFVDVHGNHDRLL